MNRNANRSVSKYRVTPRLVRAGVPTDVTVTPLGPSMRFDDQTEYTVRFIPKEIYNDTFIDRPAQFDSVKVFPQNGCLTVTYTFSEELKTMPQALNQILSGGIARTGVSAAAALLMMLPPILLFVFAQNNVIETMSNSGLKE